MSKNTLGALLNKPADVKSYGTEGCPWVLKNLNTGIEIEIENVRQDLNNREFSKLFELWKFVEDHSLRDSGMEFTTKGPLFGNDLNNAIDTFFKFAEDYKWRPSERTGTHIHFDMRDSDSTELMYLCSLYAIFERALFRWIGIQREENIYCLPWYGAQENLKYVASLGTTEDAQIYSEIVQRIQRYSALNLAALGKYGTVEFRHMDTQMDPARLKTWINLLMRLKAFAREFAKTSPDYTSLLARFSHLGPVGFAQSVFLDDFDKINYPDIERNLWTGMTLAQDVLVLHKNRFLNMFPDTELWGADKNSGFTKFFEKHPKATEIVTPEPPRPARTSDFRGWTPENNPLLPAGFIWTNRCRNMGGDWIIYETRRGIAWYGVQHGELGLAIQVVPN